MKRKQIVYRDSKGHFISGPHKKDDKYVYTISSTFCSTLSELEEIMKKWEKNHTMSRDSRIFMVEKSKMYKPSITTMITYKK